MPVCAAVCYFKSAGAAVCEKPRRMPALISIQKRSEIQVGKYSSQNSTLAYKKRKIALFK